MPNTESNSSCDKHGRVPGDRSQGAYGISVGAPLEQSHRAAIALRLATSVSRRVSSR